MRAATGIRWMPSCAAQPAAPAPAAPAKGRHPALLEHREMGLGRAPPRRKTTATATRQRVGHAVLCSLVGTGTWGLMTPSGRSSVLLTPHAQRSRCSTKDGRHVGERALLALLQAAVQIGVMMPGRRPMGASRMMTAQTTCKVRMRDTVPLSFSQCFVHGLTEFLNPAECRTAALRGVHNVSPECAKPDLIILHAAQRASQTLARPM